MFIYAGTFVVAFTTLVLEITLTRLLSVITWYHLAFFAISTAMLGMTAGAVTVYLLPNRFRVENIYQRIAETCGFYILAVPVSLFILCHIRLPQEITDSPSSIFLLLMVTVACSLPFYFSGIAITAVLTKVERPIGKLYASDLIGASFGCLLVLWGLELMSAPRLILLSGIIMILAVISFLRAAQARDFLRRQGIKLALFAVVVLALYGATFRVAPVYIKGERENPENNLLEKWNSFSRIVVEKGKVSSPSYWGPSPFAPQDQRILRYQMVIDGNAGTSVSPFKNEKDAQYLGFDVTNVVYGLRPSGNAFIIGIGGGRDAQSALLFGHERVVGVDVNPIFIKLHHTLFKDFSGLAGNPRVALVADEARSYISRTPEKFTVIQMSLVDTWAATGAGAFTLTENGLYTVEAWKIFFEHLSPNGIFSVARWYNPYIPAEASRMVSLAVATLMQEGVRDYSRHIAVVTVGKVAVLLLSRDSLSEVDVAKLEKFCVTLGYKILVRPGVIPDEPILAGILAARSMEDIEHISSTRYLNVNPSTDDRPFFFNMLSLGGIFLPILNPGVMRGNYVATCTLIELIVILLVLVLVTIVLPLKISDWQRKKAGGRVCVFRPGAFYFSLIGAGFMFVEIGLMQNLSVFLGHPFYALGIVLFTIIASTGCGSALSERLPLEKRPWIFVYPVLTVCAIFLVRLAYLQIGGAMVAATMFWKIIASIMMIAPLGILMGLFFPTGMTLVRKVADSDTPWFWALNGIFGVLCSALAVFFSIYFGISTNYYLGGICYALTLLCLARISKTSLPVLPNGL
ncbi:MAG: hypothetical protein PHN49_08110 [Candidatus Omnitrophica bacterium]|nr:hypothetical protein [Candidatus Omnitrophota bacterium]